MTDRERLLKILNVPIHPHENVDPLEAVADFLLDNGVTFQKWIPGKKPPKEWKDEKGDAINFLAVIPGMGIDIANWIEPTKCWFCMGVPCKVTHWMPLPEPPQEENDAV